MSSGFGKVVEVELRGRCELLVDDLVAEIDALVADVDAGASDQLLDLSLRLPAEAAEQLLITLARPSHPCLLLLRKPLFVQGQDSLARILAARKSLKASASRPQERRRLGDHERCSITRSMIPYSLASAAVM